MRTAWYQLGVTGSDTDFRNEQKCDECSSGHDQDGAGHAVGQGTVFGNNASDGHHGQTASVRASEWVRVLVFLYVFVYVKVGKYICK